LGVVVNAHKLHLFGGKSELKLKLTGITGVDGRLIAIETGTIEQEGHGSKLGHGARRATLGLVAGAVRGAAQGTGMMSKDDHARERYRAGMEMPEGMPLTFTLTAPATVRSR
jgi:hypothetical protein